MPIDIIKDQWSMGRFRIGLKQRQWLICLRPRPQTPCHDRVSLIASNNKIGSLSVADKAVSAYNCGLNAYLALKLLYCIVFKYLYSAPQQPWANVGVFGSII